MGIEIPSAVGVGRALLDQIALVVAVRIRT
jgi:hypothetical protein